LPAQAATAAPLAFVGQDSTNTSANEMNLIAGLLPSNFKSQILNAGTQTTLKQSIKEEAVIQASAVMREINAVARNGTLSGIQFVSILKNPVMGNSFARIHGSEPAEVARSGSVQSYDDQMAIILSQSIGSRMQKIGDYNSAGAYSNACLMTKIVEATARAGA
jgi:mRNA deadenylase 3'-5' endonuclease subunit Ccr4